MKCGHLSDFSYIDRLPYGLSTERRKKRWLEIQDLKIEPVEINCIGAEKFEVLGNVILKDSVVLKIKIYNNKINQWEIHNGGECNSICSICGTFMLVRYIKGTTWLAMCSETCYTIYFALKENRVPEDIDLSKLNKKELNELATILKI